MATFDDSTLLVTLGPTATDMGGRKGVSGIFHEYDEAHAAAGNPEGEALVVAGRIVKVGNTFRVRDALAKGVLRYARPDEVESPQAPSVAEVIDQTPAPATAAKAAKAAAGK